MTILTFLFGVLIGIFIPGPFNEKIRSALKRLWNKIFKNNE